MDDPTGAVPPASTGGGAREEVVANGVAFLLHPRVQQAPLSQRITFLERKVRVLGRSMGSMDWCLVGGRDGDGRLRFKVDRRPPATIYPQHPYTNRA